ncbi:MAG: hypothetical protein EOO88_01605 [Pedobacter sp.]|nr:MAG: hypothetical protein EOO88_01605 [Pedobacter sp.]
MTDEKLKTISFNAQGFTLINPILDERHFISWESIDTIIFGPEIIYTDHSEFIIYLNQPPEILLTQGAWWLNKITFWMKSKTKKKIRISDEWNRDFSKFMSEAKLYLEDVHDVDITEDIRRGVLVSRTVVKDDNRTTIQEHWTPERTTDFKWKMVYDRYNRTVADIYNRDKGI